MALGWWGDIHPGESNVDREDRGVLDRELRGVILVRLWFLVFSGGGAYFVVSVLPVLWRQVLRGLER